MVCKIVLGIATSSHVISDCLPICIDLNISEMFNSKFYVRIWNLPAFVKQSYESHATEEKVRCEITQTTKIKKSCLYRCKRKYD